MSICGSLAHSKKVCSSIIAHFAVPLDCAMEIRGPGRPGAPPLDQDRAGQAVAGPEDAGKSVVALVGAGHTAAMDPVTLETARLLLRPFGPSDADAVYAACQDEDIQYYTPAPSPFRREDAEKYVGETAPQGWAGDRDHILGAFRSDNGALVGSFCLTRLSEGSTNSATGRPRSSAAGGTPRKRPGSCATGVSPYSGHTGSSGGRWSGTCPPAHSPRSSASPSREPCAVAPWSGVNRVTGGWADF